MARGVGYIETEIKLRVPDAAEARALLEKHRYAVARPRVFESNAIYDTAEHSFRLRGELIRLRRAGNVHTLTLKSPALSGRHKRREELETRVADGAVLEAILERLGLTVAFRYEKYRTEYGRETEGGLITVDETPIGTFLELEGPSAWIDTAAAELDFGESDYILSSYGALYFEYCRWHRIEPGFMVFEP